MCTSFLQQLTPHGRIVNLSSVASSLKPYSADIQARFRNATSLQDLSDLAKEYEVSFPTSYTARRKSSGSHENQSQELLTVP